MSNHCQSHVDTSNHCKSHADSAYKIKPNQDNNLTNDQNFAEDTQDYSLGRVFNPLVIQS